MAGGAISHLKAVEFVANIGVDISRICAIFSVRLTLQPKCTVMKLALDSRHNTKHKKGPCHTRVANRPHSLETNENNGRIRADRVLFARLYFKTENWITHDSTAAHYLWIYVVLLANALNARVYHVVCAAKRIIGFWSDKIHRGGKKTSTENTQINNGRGAAIHSILAIGSGQQAAIDKWHWIMNWMKVSSILGVGGTLVFCCCFAFFLLFQTFFTPMVECRLFLQLTNGMVLHCVENKQLRESQPISGQMLFFFYFRNYFYCVHMLFIRDSTRWTRSVLCPVLLFRWWFATRPKIF